MKEKKVPWLSFDFVGQYLSSTSTSPPMIRLNFNVLSTCVPANSLLRSLFPLILHSFFRYVNNIEK